MLRRTSVVAAVVGGLLLAGTGMASAGSGVHGGGQSGHQGHAENLCSAGHDSVLADCGNTYVYSPNILGGLLNLLSVPPADGGGGNNGGGNN
ncbi:chaplin [Kitasatospora sp. NPDC052868]|uniref:chaplin n=1 Tax=Kitasatospora sp. NPDC052868 TaxID=3364060 RepID=UPI0037C94682